MELILIIEIVASIIILAVLQKQVAKALEAKNNYETRREKMKINLNVIQTQLSSLFEEITFKKKSLLELINSINTKEKVAIARAEEIKILDNQLQITQAKFRDFSMRDGYEEFEKVQDAKEDLDKYVADIQNTLKKNKAYFNPSICATTINMLLEKLKQCCQVDLSGDVDDMLRQDIIDIANESKKSNDEQDRRKKKKGSSYER